MATLEQLRERGALSSLDESFARALGRIGGDARPELLLAAALVSRQVALGDVCLDLSDWVGRGAEAAAVDDVAWPRVEEWTRILRESDLVSAPSGAPNLTPLVLDADGRLYLQRLHTHESEAAAAFRGLASRVEPAPDGPQLEESIDRLLPAEGPGADAPRAAARIAASRRLCVISGRPGTGKTTTAARLLAVLIEQALRDGCPAPAIALAAPTGKAAARLSEAIAGARGDLDCSDEVRRLIPNDARTLHRLLRIGSRGALGRRREGVERLVADVVLVDEASMVDLALMARLLEALPPSCRLVLLGDPDQLASVEAGAVFADLCGAGLPPRSAAREASPVAPCVVTLEHSHRFGSDSGIGALAAAIQRGDADGALALLDDPGVPDVERVASPTPSPTQGLPTSLRDLVLEGFAGFARADDAAAQLASLSHFRVLSALRDGPSGVRELNRVIDRGLVGAGLLPPAPPGAPAAFPGRPVLVTRNAPHVGLFNGDVGVVRRERDAGTRVFFEQAPGLSGPGPVAPRSFGVSRLPPHEPVFAMTVHKSQGSEFDEVLLVLPDEPLPLLTRELVYTAVTRARERVVVQGSAEVLREAIRQRVLRASGLGAALWPRAGDRGTV